MPLSPITRRRLLSSGVLLAVIALGVLSRAVPIGWSLYDKSLGDVLYATAAYLALALLFPSLRVGLLAILAMTACSAVDLLQHFEVNAYLLKVPVLRWFLGTTCLWHDLACYLLGIALAVGLDVLVLRPHPG